jgi:hypothetical protein
MRSPLGRTNSVDHEAMKRNGFLDQGILIVKVDDPRLAWQERMLLEQIGTRLYGERRKTE